MMWHPMRPVEDKDGGERLRNARWERDVGKIAVVLVDLFFRQVDNISFADLIERVREDKDLALAALEEIADIAEGVIKEEHRNELPQGNDILSVIQHKANEASLAAKREEIIHQRAVNAVSFFAGEINLDPHFDPAIRWRRKVIGTEEQQHMLPHVIRIAAELWRQQDCRNDGDVTHDVSNQG